MVPIRGEWTRFADKQEQNKYYRKWGLIPPKSLDLCPVMVTDGYFGIPEPCKVVGYQEDYTAVIELPDGYHAIFGEYLAELQPHVKGLPRGVTFAEVLSHYIVISIETTGVDLENDDLLEIAAVRYSYGNKMDEFHTLVRPRNEIPAEITNVTGITNESVADAPTPEEVSSDLAAYLGSTPIIGHNVKAFIIPFLSAHTKVNLSNLLVDTLSLVPKAYPLLTIRSLSCLADALHLHCNNNRRVLDYAYATNALIWACLNPRNHERYMWNQFLNEKNKQYKIPTPLRAVDFVCDELIEQRPQEIGPGYTEYIVLDIETTGFDKTRNELLEVAAVRYSKDGEELDKYHTMVRPKHQIPPEISELTGIFWEDVQDAPAAEDIASGLTEFLSDYPLCGHNIKSFDIPFIKSKTGISLSNASIDTISMAKKAFPGLKSYALEYLKETLELSQEKSHRALADVYINNSLICACTHPEKYQHLLEKKSKKEKIPASKDKYQQFNHTRVSDIKPTTSEIDPSNPLYQKGIVFTGELSIAREDAMQMAVNAGGIVKTAVSRKISYLVVGNQSQMAFGNSMSGKESKARELIQSGKAQIEIINEQEFLALVSNQKESGTNGLVCT